MKTGADNLALHARGHRASLRIDDLCQPVKRPRVKARRVLAPRCEYCFFTMSVPRKNLRLRKNRARLFELPFVNIFRSEKNHVEVYLALKFALLHQIAQQVQRRRIRLQHADAVFVHQVQIRRHRVRAQKIGGQTQLAIERLVLKIISLRADEAPAQHRAPHPEPPTRPTPARVHERALDLEGLDQLVKPERNARRAARRHVTPAAAANRECGQIVAKRFLRRERQMLHVRRRANVVGLHAGFFVQLAITLRLLARGPHQLAQLLALPRRDFLRGPVVRLPQKTPPAIVRRRLPQALRDDCDGAFEPIFLIGRQALEQCVQSHDQPRKNFST